MKVPCVDIASYLKESLSSRVSKLKKRGIVPCLSTILIGESSEQLSFVAIKAKVARSLSIKFELSHLKKAPSFVDFARLLKEKSQDSHVSGIIIQQPLPFHLQTATIYNFIPDLKEIEGHKSKSPHLPPIGLAVLTVLKYIFQKSEVSEQLLPNFKTDVSFFKQVFKNKKIIVVGRGVTGGKPIGKTLNLFKINYININSQTPSPEQYFQEADIIITAVGKNVLKPEMLKPGVALINAGLRREKNKLKGDYSENAVKNIASSYTPTPQGIGPIDVLYLYENLIDAAEMQEK